MFCAKIEKEKKLLLYRRIAASPRNWLAKDSKVASSLSYYLEHNYIKDHSSELTANKVKTGKLDMIRNYMI